MLFILLILELLEYFNNILCDILVGLILCGRPTKHMLSGPEMVDAGRMVSCHVSTWRRHFVFYFLNQILFISVLSSDNLQQPTQDLTTEGFFFTKSFLHCSFSSLRIFYPSFFLCLKITIFF